MGTHLAAMHGEYTPGAIFGELAALRLNKVRALTIRAKTDAVVYELEGGDFEESFLDRPEVPHHMPFVTDPTCLDRSFFEESFLDRPKALNNALNQPKAILLAAPN